MSDPNVHLADAQPRCPVVTKAEFSERCKALLAEPGKSACPDCGGQLVAGYGIAGGGIGPYLLCLGECGVLLKASDVVAP